MPTLNTTVDPLSYNPYKFHVYHNTTQAITTSGGTVAFNTEHFDTGSNFASNTFTAPVAGFYQFSAQLAWAATGSQTRCTMTLVCSTFGSKVIGDVSTGAAAFGMTGTTLVPLVASETVTLNFTPVGATTTLRAGSANTWFMGALFSIT